MTFNGIYLHHKFTCSSGHFGENLDSNTNIFKMCFLIHSTFDIHDQESNAGS